MRSSSILVSITKMTIPLVVMLMIENHDCGRYHKIPVGANQREVRYAEGETNSHTCRNGDKKNPDQKSSSLAQKAAQEAKAASDAQNIAGQQAAHQVKTQLAEKAVHAAKAVDEVLSRKKMLVAELQEEVKEAQSVVQEETSSLDREQSNVNAALQAARQSQDQLKTLSHAVQTAKANAANAQAAASGVQKTLREKEELLDAARRRVDELSNQLKVARQELTNTNRAAAKANAAATEAKANASRNKRRLENIRRMRVVKRLLQPFIRSTTGLATLDGTIEGEDNRVWQQCDLYRHYHARVELATFHAAQLPAGYDAHTIKNER
ncbi:uncharacterized protein LOC117229444 isoform X1 [Megalopta genalis]|uniref:uncharacterized protein LOC117229444 isoform X1 n=1 Tax=Megalopta genalis TaxID=115081 RepID=UPI003FD21115